jgi:8-hydroxy-5-deazaflavin:NADPH oxidoreductase
MKIAILGSGSVGGKLARLWHQKGHEVILGVRNANSDRTQATIKACDSQINATTFDNAVAASRIVLLAVPWEAAKETIASVSSWQKKILIDCINPLGPDFASLQLGHFTSAAEEIAAWAPEAKVIKAFNTVTAAILDDPDFAGVPAGNFICGDDANAKDKVADLVEELGFEAIDSGPLQNARLLEPLALLMIHQAQRPSIGPEMTFTMLRRRPKKREEREGLNKVSGGLGDA